MRELIKSEFNNLEQVQKYVFKKGKISPERIPVFAKTWIETQMCFHNITYNPNEHMYYYKPINVRWY